MVLLLLSLLQQSRLGCYNLEDKYLTRITIQTYTHIMVQRSSSLANFLYASLFVYCMFYLFTVNHRAILSVHKMTPTIITLMLDYIDTKFAKMCLFFLHHTHTLFAYLKPPSLGLHCTRSMMLPQTGRQLNCTHTITTTQNLLQGKNCQNYQKVLN